MSPQNNADDGMSSGWEELAGLDGPGFLTPGEVAAVLHVDPNTVARWSNEGKLAAIRTPGGHRRYPTSEVARLAKGGAAVPFTGRSVVGRPRPAVPGPRTPED